jgi:O-antigen/teichoic acid export membrane protein
MFLLAALAEEVILVVLGDQWTEAAPIFKILAFAAVVQPVMNPVGWVYMSLGQTDRMFRWALMAVPVILISFLIGLPWGAVGVALSYTCCSLTVILFPALWFAFRYSPLTVRGWTRMVYRPFILGLLVYGAVELLPYGSIPGSPKMTIVSSLAVSIGVLSAAMLLWRGARKEALDGLRLLAALRSFA